MQVTGNNINQNKSLSIRLCTDGFSFSAYSNLEQVENCLYLQYKVNPDVSMAANLKAAFESVELLSNHFESVQVLVDAPCCHLPLECFEEEEKEEVFFYNYPFEKGKMVFYNVLTNCNVVTLFSVDKNVYQLLTDYCPNVRLYALETPVLEHLVMKSKIRETQKLYAVFYPRKMFVFVMNGGKLTFANRFSASDNKDYIYFILQIWKSQGLSQSEDELHLVGEISQRDAFISELHRFIKQVYPINPSVEFGSLGVKESQLPYDLAILLSKSF